MSSLFDPTTTVGLAAPLALAFLLGVVAAVRYASFMSDFFRGAPVRSAVFFVITQFPAASLGVQWVLGYRNCACSAAEYRHAQTMTGNMAWFLAAGLVAALLFTRPMYSRRFRNDQEIRVLRWLMYAYATSHVYALAAMMGYIAAFGSLASGEQHYATPKAVFAFIQCVIGFCCIRAAYIMLEPWRQQRTLDRIAQRAQGKAPRRKPWWYYLQFVLYMWYAPPWPPVEPEEDEE